MSAEEQIKLEDTDDIKNVIIQVNIKDGKTIVWSGFSAWENIGYLIEALAATAAECIRQGISKKKVYKAIYDYII